MVLCKDQRLAGKRGLTLSLICCVLHGLSFPISPTAGVISVQVLGPFCPSHSSAVFRGELLRLSLAHLALCCNTYVTETAPDPPSTYSPVGHQIVTAQDRQGWDGGNRDIGVRARMGEAQDPSGEGVCPAQPEGSKVYLN